jgi:hypothetical protein
MFWRSMRRSSTLPREDSLSRVTAEFAMAEEIHDHPKEIHGAMELLADRGLGA